MGNRTLLEVWIRPRSSLQSLLYLNLMIFFDSLLFIDDGCWDTLRDCWIWSLGGYAISWLKEAFDKSALALVFYLWFLISGIMTGSSSFLGDCDLWFNLMEGLLNSLSTTGLEETISWYFLLCAYLTDLSSWSWLITAGTLVVSLISSLALVSLKSWCSNWVLSILSTANCKSCTMF